MTVAREGWLCFVNWTHWPVCKVVCQQFYFSCTIHLRRHDMVHTPQTQLDAGQSTMFSVLGCWRYFPRELWINEWTFYLSTDMQYSKTVKIRTVSTGQKGSSSNSGLSLAAYTQRPPCTTTACVQRPTCTTSRIPPFAEYHPNSVQWIKPTNFGCRGKVPWGIEKKLLSDWS